MKNLLGFCFDFPKLRLVSNVKHKMNFTLGIHEVANNETDAMLKPYWKQSDSKSVWVRKNFLVFSDALRASDVWARTDTNTHECFAETNKRNNWNQHFTDSESIHRVITMAAAASTTTAMSTTLVRRVRSALAHL